MIRAIYHVRYDVKPVKKRLTKRENHMFIDDLTYGRILVLANRDVTMKPCMYGEDYYIQMLVNTLKVNRANVDIAMPLNREEFKVYMREGGNKIISTIDEIIRGYDILILHNISPRKVLRAKIKYKKIKIIMPVYFLWNKGTPVITNIRNRIGLTLLQFIIDEYLVPSPKMVKSLRLQGIIKKIRFIPPVYRCKYCSFEKNKEKLERLKAGLPEKVKVVYIGSFSLPRLALLDVIKMFSKDQSRTYEVTIYTATPIKEGVYRINNVKVSIVRKVLSDGEKCRILSSSHLFIAPRRGTTMEPSISVMEAEHHGNIIIRF